MLFDLSKFDEYKEDNRREVKRAKGGLPDSLWETYSSFANCYGGVIILGVIENADGTWRTSGLENERKLLKDFWDTIHNQKKVSMNLLTDKDGELHPTAAGLLMFGEEYHIVREFPEYFLDFREMLDPSMRWTDRMQSSSGEWTGNLFDFYFSVYNKLLKNIKTPFKMEGGIRIDDTPVHKALREALANCLVNTDFYLPRAIVIKVDREKIVLENPGSVRTGKKQMLKGGISDPRNKSLMKMFNLINIGERAGSGVPDIYSVWKDEGWEEPIVEEQYGPDRTILTLPLVKKKQNRMTDKKQPIKTADKKQPIKTADKTNDNKEKVIEFLKENGTSKTVDIARYIRLSDRRTRTILKIMTEEGIIIHEGNNKNRVYRLNSNDITNE